MENILVVKNITKKFSNQTILQDIDLTLNKGEIGFVLGANNSGKSTLMKAVAGLIPVNSGQIIIDGDVVKNNNQPSRQILGALVDEPALVPYMSGREHLQLYATGDDAAQKIDQMARKFNLTESLDQPVTEYSLSKKQKLALALAFINDAKLIVLDEPFNSLDENENEKLQQLILEMTQSGTSFLIAENKTEPFQKRADKIFYLANGQLTQNPTAESTNIIYRLRTSNDVIAREVLLQNNYPIQNIKTVSFEVRDEHTLARAIKLLVEAKIDVKNVESSQV